MNNLVGYDVAFEIANQAHEGQIRKNGEPYINHPIRVSNLCKNEGLEYQIVSLLHDVIEDSEYSIVDLERLGFSVTIIEAVKILTHDKRESYLHYILNIKNNTIASFVKLQDIRDNLNGAKGTLKDKYQLAYWILTN